MKGGNEKSMQTCVTGILLSLHLVGQLLTGPYDSKSVGKVGLQVQRQVTQDRGNSRLVQRRHPCPRASAETIRADLVLKKNFVPGVLDPDQLKSDRMGTLDIAISTTTTTSTAAMPDSSCSSSSFWVSFMDIAELLHYTEKVCLLLDFPHDKYCQIYQERHSYNATRKRSNPNLTG